MTDTLDSILSGAGASAPVSDQTPRVDEPEALITDPVENKIGTDQVEGEPHPDEKPDGDKANPDKSVGAAFKAQREGQAKRYTEQVADFEKRLADSDARWEQRMAQLVQSLAPKQPQQEAPDFFADPQAAVRAELTPFVQAQQQQREETSQLLAIEKHGEETVSEAFRWLEGRFRQNPQAATAERDRIMATRHPYGELVKAYKQSQVLSEIGDDPQAYRERIKAELLSEIQNGNGPPAAPHHAAPPAVMPSDFAGARNAGVRTGPAWTGPPPLGSIFASK